LAWGASNCNFYSYWQCQKCCLVLFSCFLNSETWVGLHLIGLRREQGKNNVYNPADLEETLPEIGVCSTRKTAGSKYNILRFTFQFWFSSKFSKSSMGPLPVLSEDEEKVLVKWITDYSWKGFSQRKLDVQLSRKEFLTINQRKTPFKNNMSGNGWFQAFLRHYPVLATWTSENVTYSSSTLGEADVRK